MTATVPERAALDVRVRGVVQGVGFRPFVHRLAARHRLDGWVRNTAGSVEIAVEGPPGELEAFLSALAAEAPPLARIETIEKQECVAAGRAGFAILASTDTPGEHPPVSPDVAICDACLREFEDPSNRRHHYPFITCTDCGPRFTVIESMPYDRERTSMRAFTQCPACLHEYQTPGDRRHHSETNSCPVCGPRLWFTDAQGRTLAIGAEEAITAAAALLVSGGVLAVRGLGGFHLACDATSEPAVALLRARKHREAKPLAVMVRTLAEARALVALSPGEEALLTSAERPIVLADRVLTPALALNVAPGLGQLGVALAYTPVHHLLLLAAGRPLVMTSGNRSEEPIAIGNEEALARLAGIADGFLLHDREIVARYDDSVVRQTPAGTMMIRRARGYAPLPLRLPVPSPIPLLAVGPHLKNTFALAAHDRAWVSQHVGDLENFETLQHFRDALARYRVLFRLEPEAVVHDLHPGYLSTTEAESLGLTPRLAVQHHHAHIAAVLAEHGLEGPVVGIAYDGTGYGGDGTVWGGELLVADLQCFRRVGHLRQAPLPGGDLAARNPWRSALGYLSLEPRLEPFFARALAGVDAIERGVAERQIARQVNAPLASSMGRLFDAAAAVLGVRHAAQFEGQAAMELEALAGHRGAAELEFPVENGPGGLVLDPLPLLAELGSGLRSRKSVPDLAADFHASVARATALAARQACEDAGLDTVALGGGVFQNARLLGSIAHRLTAFGLRVLVPRRLSPNDGAVSYGQAAIAAARLAHGRTT
ncbi:MAG: carbamoyltransferase HypF [Gemmatimonadales bacterium]